MKKAYTLIELLVTIATVTILLSMVFGLGIRLFGFSGFNYSEGQRTGIVYKFSKKG